MSTSTVNLDTIELESTLRPMGANGAPGSEDYNDSMKEILADLATVTEYINDILRPLLNGLPASATAPTNSPVGIEGRTIFADSSDSTSLFFDQKRATALSIADSLRLLNGMVTAIQTKINDVDLRVTGLATQLSVTNQNDIARSIQALSTSIGGITLRLISLESGGSISGSGVSSAPLTVPYSTNPVFNLSQSTVQQITLTGDASPTFTNPIANTEYTLFIRQDSGGGHLFTWPSSYKGGISAGLTPNTVTIFNLFFDGTNFYLVGAPIQGQ